MSWHIKSEMDFTQVTRFYMDAAGENLGETKYKTVASSQIRKDKSRSTMWRRMSKDRQVQENDSVFLLSKADTFNGKCFLHDFNIQGVHRDLLDQM